MQRLRRPWTERERLSFVREVSTFQPGTAFRDGIAPKHVEADLLFRAPRVRADDASPGFTVTLGGDFDVGDDYTVNVLAAAAWVLEIRALDGTVDYAVSPTKAYAERSGLPTAAIKATDRYPGCPDFEARLFTRVGRADGNLTDLFGVRVYMEGFRVLPYGEPGDDWLDINAKYVLRDRGLAKFKGTVFDATVADMDDDDAGLIVPTQRAVFGAVLLTEAGAPRLRMLVNREGFIPDEGFLAIRDALSNGLALQTRISAALRPGRRPVRSVPATHDPAPEPANEVAPTIIAPTFDRAVTLVREFATGARLATAEREEVAMILSELVQAREELLDEQAMLRILASLGTQTAAFVHEINAALGSLSALQQTVNDMLREPPTRTQVAELQRSVDALKRTLERQAAYLVRIVSPDARRRRSRQFLHEHFEHAKLLLEAPAHRSDIALQNAIPRDLKSPPMFPAELTSLFTNLLSNAIKAAGHGGRVCASGESRPGLVNVVVENTGVAVDLATAQRWFDAYQSTTARVDPSLGQGMGLGLTITRAMLAEYRGEIEFIEPSSGFATAVSVELPL
jgi:signal transduction histidine kinase